MTYKEQLLEEAKTNLSIPDNDALKVIEEIITVNTESESKELVRINPITHKAETVKLKNLTINLKKVMIDSTEMGLAIFGVVATPWLIPVAALIAVNKLWAHVKVDIHPMLAIVLQAMWENPTNKSQIRGYHEALILVNKKLALLKQPQISAEELQKLLTQLELLKVIEQKGDLIFLRETITFDSEY